jgi:hypothetical protein
VNQGIVLAHGIGGVQDLPLPRSLAITGAVAALLLSFVVLAYAWRSPRFATSLQRPAPAWLARVVDSSPWRIGLRVFGLAVFTYAVLTALFGQDRLTNPFFGMFYVFLWVAPVPLSLLFGPFWRAVSPVRTLHLGVARVSGSAPGQGLLQYPQRWGYWPAALGLFAYVWLELVAESNADLATVRLWFAGYVASMLVGGAVFGDRFFEYADPFEVYSTLISKLSVWARQDGRLVLRSPLANLHTLVPAPGLVAVVGVLLGSTAFDSFSGATFWARVLQDNAASATLLQNLMLVLFCGAVGGLIALGGAGTRGGDTPPTALPGLFAHSVVPIIVGYIVAHYLTFLVHVGQSTLISMSDPFGTGADWFGTADWAVNYWFAYHPRLVAVIKVLGVVTGHVVAVVAAHDRAVSLLPRDHQVRGQLPMLVVMVAFTSGGLFLLFAS